MKHYILLKFKSNYLDEEIFSYIEKVFDDISALKNVEHVEIKKNCIQGHSNMDVMIEMIIKNEETLKFYLDHDLHRNFVRTVSEHVLLKIAFDCE